MAGFVFVDLWRPRSSLLGLLASSPRLRGQPIMSYSGDWPNNASDFFLNDLKIARTMHQLNVLFFKRENRIQRYTPPIHERVKIIFQLLVIVAFS